MKTSMKSGDSFSLMLPIQYSGPKSTGMRGMVVVSERPVGAKGLLQFVHREPGIRREERPRRIDRFQHDFRTAAAAHAETQDPDQLRNLGRLAVLDLDHLLLRRPVCSISRACER